MRHLFSSELARHQFGLRVYAALLIACMLLLVGLHHALQHEVQTQFRHWFQKQFQLAGVSVEGLHYRLLRGDLTLSHLHWKHGDDRLDVDEVFIHAPSILHQESQPMSIGIRGWRLDLHQSSIDERVLPHLIAKALPYIHKLSLLKGHIRLSTQGQSWQMQDVSLHVKPQEQGHSLNLRATMGQQGHLELQGIWPQKQDFWPSMRLNWQMVELTPFAKLLGLQKLHARSSGWLMLHATGRQQRVFNGEMRLKQAAHPLSKLIWKGKQDHHAWHTQMQCDALPLKFMQALLNLPHQWHLEQGFFTGSWTWQRAYLNQAWQHDFDGSLSQLALHSDSGAQLELERLHIQKGQLNAQEHRFSAAQLTVYDATLDLHVATASQPNDSTVPIKKTTQQPDRLITTSEPAAKDPPWQLAIAAIGLEKIRLTVSKKQQLLLQSPLLQGKGSWHKDATVLLNLHSMPNPETKAIWRLALTHQSHWQLRAHVQNMPIQDWLAYAEDLSVPVKGLSVHGYLNGQLQSRYHEQHWLWSADVQLRDLALRRAGNILQAEKGRLQFHDWSANDTEHVFDELSLQHWVWGMSMQPLSALQQRQASTWKAYTKRWQVKKLAFHDGRIWLGRDDAVWFDRIDLNVKQWLAKQTARLHMRADMAEGVFTLHAKVAAMQAYPYWSLDASLHDALPFILNDWLRLSDLPRFRRGRMGMSLHMQSKAQQPEYQAHIQAWLKQWALWDEATDHDAFSTLFGSHSQQLLQRLSDKHGRALIDQKFHGNWDTQAFSSNELLRMIAHYIETQKTPRLHQTPKPWLTRMLRLRKHALSHNERLRLRKVASVYRQHRGSIIELQAILGELQLDDELTADILDRYQNIERYLRLQGVKKGDLYPVWPQLIEQSGSDMSGVQLQVRKP